MAKLDVYLKSIERFGASGAVLVSNQQVTLRFPAGDRQATQITPHDQLVAIVREIAPPAALAAIDQNRAARFEYEAFSIAVAPRPNAWQVMIDPRGAGAPAPGASAPSAAPVELAIERGQYDEGPSPVAAAQTSGSAVLDAITAAARARRGTDVYLAAGAAAMVRVGGEVHAADDRPLDRDALARELGQIAPPDARAAWAERGAATFTYDDTLGRVRASLARDHRGPTAALRLLPAEPAALDRLGAPAEVTRWLAGRGLVAIAGASGAGKTTLLGALVAALGERRVVEITDVVEVPHGSASVSQRAVGSHVASAATGIAAAVREGADAIAVDAVLDAAAAAAVADAVAAGHLVLVVVPSATAAGAADQLAALLPAERRGAFKSGLLGAVAVSPRGGGRSFELAAI